MIVEYKTIGNVCLNVKGKKNPESLPHPRTLKVKVNMRDNFHDKDGRTIFSVVIVRLSFSHPDRKLPPVTV